MTDSDTDQGAVKPSEARGGTTPDAAEVTQKGSWSETATEGVVPAELGGTDAPDELKADEDPELGSAVTGRTTGSDEPTTDQGIDPQGGDQADATTDGGPDLPTQAEPDLKDAPVASKQPDSEAAR
ncbi:MAG: hypothetical protein LC685_03020 [Actinobacteria bacterium]|nr:hypothetical protein [Actinomycetota bacterium]